MTPTLPKRLSLAALSVFSGVLLLLISLGFWQLGRAEEKRQYLQQQQALMAEDTLQVNAATLDDLDFLKYRLVNVSGHYDNRHQFLIDNQHSGSKVGYFVLTPFVITGSDKGVLVNRGWVPLNPDRSVLPEVSVNEAVGIIRGRVKNFPSVGVKLAGAEIPTDTWPSVVQVAEAPVLARKVGYGLFSFQIELAPEMPEGYQRDWQQEIVMPPEKHIAYAIQWFGLAFTFCILFFWLQYKKTQ